MLLHTLIIRGMNLQILFVHMSSMEISSASHSLVPPIMKEALTSLMFLLLIIPEIAGEE